MKEPRIRTQFIDSRGWLIRIWERPSEAAKRGLGEPFAYDRDVYSEEYPPDEAREILQRDVDALERRLQELRCR